MATLKLKNSSVASKVPLTTDLAFGELALNYADGKLYYKKADGTTVDFFVSGSATSGVTSFNTRTGAVTLGSGDVIAALGYTPYNATNPSGYITGSGSITGNAATATTATNLSGGTVNATTLTTSSTVTHNAGTANGVAYLNDSKVLTSGSAMQFDGTTLAAPVLSVSSGIFEYANTVSANYSIAAGRNALSIGPIISINPGITVTVASESVWSITN